MGRPSTCWHSMAWHSRLQSKTLSPGLATETEAQTLLRVLAFTPVGGAALEWAAVPQGVNMDVIGCGTPTCLLETKNKRHWGMPKKKKKKKKKKGGKKKKKKKKKKK